MQQTLINGNRYSFTNISLIPFDFQVGYSLIGAGTELPRGVIKSISYDATQEPGIVQGNQVVMTGRTQGYGMGSGSFELLVSEMDDFFLQLSGGSTFPIMSVNFGLTIAYSVNDIDVRFDALIGCRITKIGSSNSQGSDATTKTCDLSIARVILNGIDAFADPLNP